MTKRKSERDDVKLRRLLGIAARRFGAEKGLIWSDYETGSEIAQFVRECEKGVEHGTLDSNQKRELGRVFRPSGDWDRVVGDVELGNDIFALLHRLYGDEMMVG